MPDSLQSTLRSAATGDAEAWRSLIGAYSGRVYGLVYRQCVDGELAEEITQATFVQVVGKLSVYQEQGKFEAWLFRIALNLLRDEMRRRKRHARPTDLQTAPLTAPAHQDGSQEPVLSMMDDEEGEMVRNAIAQLSEADQQILHLRYTADLAFNQIAELLGQPLGTVLARGHRALKKLKEKLQPTEE